MKPDAILGNESGPLAHRRRAQAQARTARTAWTGGPSAEDARAEARAFGDAGTGRLGLWFGAPAGFSERVRRFARALL